MAAHKPKKKAARPLTQTEKNRNRRNAARRNTRNS